MQKEIGKEIPFGERADFLESNADAVENMGYMKSFDPDQMQELKDILSDASIRRATLLEELDEIKRQYKEKLKPLNEEIEGVLTNIKEGAEFVQEDCYKFIDHEEGMVGYYNKFGDLISTRRIKPDERQKTIFSLERTGTK